MNTDSTTAARQRVNDILAQQAMTRTHPTTQVRIQGTLGEDAELRFDSAGNVHLYVMVRQSDGLPDVLIHQAHGSTPPDFFAAQSKARLLKRDTAVTAYGLGIGTSRWQGTVCLQLVDVSILQADAPPMKGAPC